MNLYKLSLLLLAHFTACEVHYIKVNSFHTFGLDFETIGGCQRDSGEGLQSIKPDFDEYIAQLPEGCNIDSTNPEGDNGYKISFKSCGFLKLSSCIKCYCNLVDFTKTKKTSWDCFDKTEHCPNADVNCKLPICN